MTSPDQSSPRLRRPAHLSEGHALGRWDPKHAESVDDALVIFARILGEAQLQIDDVLMELGVEQREMVRPIVEHTRQQLRLLHADMLRRRPTDAA